MFDFIPDYVFLLVFGFILLIKGGDWFVDAATGIAKRFKLPELLIGATVVSIGTTLPEVMTSAMGAAAGSGAMAYGNAIGSIICNTSLIAALTVAIKPGKADKKALVFPVCFFFGAMAVYSAFAYAFGKFDLWMGVLLLCGFVVYMIVNVVNMKKNPVVEAADDTIDECELPEKNSNMSLVKDIFVLIGSALVIALGADLLVENATEIAHALNIPETIISLTIVALGTSLPELVTAITALMKGHGALSLGVSALTDFNEPICKKSLYGVGVRANDNRGESLSFGYVTDKNQRDFQLRRGGFDLSGLDLNRVSFTLPLGRICVRRFHISCSSVASFQVETGKLSDSE